MAKGQQLHTAKMVSAYQTERLQDRYERLLDQFEKLGHKMRVVSKVRPSTVKLEIGLLTCYGLYFH